VYAMQYEITLPADYDMEIIRKRVATRGHLMDGYQGLGFKAYLIRERGDDSPVNQYAPFYVWQDTAGMNRFLWGGGGFAGIVNDFGRPPVRHWTGVATRRGSASRARVATRVREPIPPGVDLTSFVADLQSDVDEAYSATLAIDPFHWEFVRFTLWDSVPATAPGDRFQVLHLSVG
jgi:Domain of unknown function (DUF4865)